MIIAFSFLSLLNNDYKSAILKFNKIARNEWLHYDVMDGNFVSNSTFDYKVVREINEYSGVFSDVHLMIKEPDKVIEEYALARTDQLTFHYESVNRDNILKIIEQIKKANMKVGISIKPDTDVKVLDEYLPYLDYILIMSVEPGRGGQKFMENSLDKIKYLKGRQKEYHYLIGVDGGINDITCLLVKQAGADVIIVGTYLADNLNELTIEKLK